MKYIREFAIILCFWPIGELMSKSLNLPIPGSIIGMLLLLLLLQMKYISLNKIHNISSFLIEYMPIFFIPAGVNIIAGLNELRGSWIAIIIISLTSTIITFTVTAYTIEFILGKKRDNYD